MKKTLYSLVFVLAYVISCLPFFVLYILSDILRFFLFTIFGYRKKIILENLRKSFPNKTDTEINKIAYKFGSFFCDMIVETIKTTTMSKKTLQRRFTSSNELLEFYMRQGRSVIGVGTHYGNFVWATMIAGFESEYPGMVVYKKLSNEYADNFMYRIRSKFGAIMIPMEKVMRTIIMHKNDPWGLCLASDQIPAGGRSPYWTTFLNQETNVFLGVEKIAKKTNSVVVFADVRILSRGYYKMEYKVLTENPQETAEYEITNMHTKYLENIINENPQYWLWTHRRWKRKRHEHTISLDI